MRPAHDRPRPQPVGPARRLGPDGGGGLEFAEDDRPQRDRVGPDQFHRAGAEFLGPQPHANGGHQHHQDEGQVEEEGIGQ